jgi:hypothetical protein
VSEEPYDVARERSPADPGDGLQQPEKSGSIGAGVAFGVLGLWAVYVGGGVGQGPYASSGRFLALSKPFIPIAVYMAVAIVLSIVRRTSRFGAGMLIGMGVFILLDGLCLGILARGGA